MTFLDIPADISAQSDKKNALFTLIKGHLFSPKGELKRGRFLFVTLFVTIILSLYMMSPSWIFSAPSKEITEDISKNIINLQTLFTFFIYCTGALLYCYITFCLFCKRFRNIGISPWWLVIFYLICLVSLKEPSSLAFLYMVMIIIFSIMPSKIPVVGPKVKLAPIAVEPTTNNYFLRHWRGEHSLQRSWFINSWISHAISYSLIIFAFGLMEQTNSSLNSIRILTLSLVTIILLSIWQVIGCWRSAQNHKKLTNRKFWATIAQIMLILALIRAWPTFQQAVEYLKISTKTDSFSDYKIRVLEDGEVVISGDIAFGIDEELRTVLDDNKNIWLVQLNSNGGRIGPAQNIAKLIEDRNLATYTSTGCYSACTRAFMAGTHRIIKNNVKLGFHAYDFPGKDKYEIMETVNADKAYFESKGIPREFVNKALSTPPKDMWFPTTRELIDNNVVTHVEFDSKISPVNTERALYDMVDKQDVINNVVARYKKMTPQLIDEDTELRDVKRLAEIIIFEYYLPNVGSGEFNAEIFEAFKTESLDSHMCGNYEMRSILDKRINVVFRYTGNDGGHIGDAKFSHYTCHLNKT